nr:hypothetical protein [Tanacetum cinerariifolium]
LLSGLFIHNILAQHLAAAIYSASAKDIGRTQALEQEMQDLDVGHKQMKMLKAIYGVTKIKEGMSQHHSYGVTMMLPLRRNIPR